MRGLLLVMVVVGGLLAACEDSDEPSRDGFGMTPTAVATVEVPAAIETAITEWAEAEGIDFDPDCDGEALCVQELTAGSVSAVVRLGTTDAPATFELLVEQDGGGGYAVVAATEIGASD